MALLSTPEVLTDPRRVAAVRATGLRDAPADPALEGLVRALVRLVDADLAAVTLVGDVQQSFVALAGPLLADLPRELPAELVLCRHVVCVGAPFVVADTRRHPLTRGHGRLLATGLRGYAGVPIVDEDGLTLGTLCAFTTRPRAFSDDDVATLCDLATTAAAAMRPREPFPAADAAGATPVSRLLERDPLTELPTRAMLEAELDEVLATRAPAGPLAALCFDLDGFALVNASFGQSGGDETLREVARRVQPLALAPDLVARHAGDRFILVTDADADDAVARLRAALAPAIRVQDADFHLGASIGVGLWPADGRDALTLVQHAEEALDEARGDSRGGVGFYRPPGVDARRRLTLTSRLRRALAAQELELHLQPIVALTPDGEPPAFEALLRWTDPQDGPIPPALFIPAAEDGGLIDAIGAFVLEAACRQLRLWADAGLDASLAVNVSPRQLERGMLADQVAEAVARHGVRSDRLVLELTESAVMRDLAKADATLHALVDLGVSLALDDFGTGHSSLARLRELPFRTLKLDRAFLAQVPGDRQDAEVVDAVLQLATALGLTVVAEGVETEAQHAFLAERGCATAQGWLYAAAMPAPQATALLRAGGVTSGLRARDRR